MRHLVEAGPRAFPELVAAPASRWTLATLRETVIWERRYSLSGVWRVLRSLGIRWKRGRDHVRSPDPHYQAKLAEVATLREQITTVPQRQVLLYQDELTYYRQPTLASGYATAGTPRPLAERSHQANTTTRVSGALNAVTGQVTVLQASRIGIPQLVQFYQSLCRTYGTAKRLYCVQDNWPIHFHPDVLVALEPQHFLARWPRRLPPNWPTEPSARATRTWGALHLPIQLVPLPTYASWCNRIEKLWRKLHQDLLHLHPYANDLPALRQKVLAFLDQFAHGSETLLRYVGLQNST
jgi:hypothetical protein